MTRARYGLPVGGPNMSPNGSPGGVYLIENDPQASCGNRPTAAILSAVKVPEKQQAESVGARILDAAIVVFLFLFAVSAPHSIAATQTSWLIGMLLWLVRFAFRPRPKLYKTPVDYFLLGFFI